MPCILSPVPKIDQMYFAEAPKSGTPKKCKRVVLYDRVMVIEYENGTFWSPQLRNAAYCPGMWPWTDGLMKCLMSLGAITKTEYEAHMKCCRDREYRSELKCALKEALTLEKQYGSIDKLKAAAKKLGIKLEKK